jgi:hypothetical protein
MKKCLNCFRECEAEKDSYCPQCLELKSNGLTDKEIFYCQHCEEHCGPSLVCTPCEENKTSTEKVNQEEVALKELVASIEANTHHVFDGNGNEFPVVKLQHIADELEEAKSLIKNKLKSKPYVN